MDYYNAISTFKINITTGHAGVRTYVRQFASCVLVDVDDALNSIFNSDGAIDIMYLNEQTVSMQDALEVIQKLEESTTYYVSISKEV